MINSNRSLLAFKSNTNLEYLCFNLAFAAMNMNMRLRDRKLWRFSMLAQNPRWEREREKKYRVSERERGERRGEIER